MRDESVTPRPLPPFAPDTQLNVEPLTSTFIPGEYLPLTTSFDFLMRSLTQTKAERISRHLWFGGPPGRFRSLHQQHALHRTILPCEDPGLHLIWAKDSVWFKPLPPCLTNYEFFTEYICPSPELYRLACGFLFSYTNLIRWYSDYQIAKDKGFIREDVSWEQWQKFRLSLKEFFESHPEVIHTRYQYGDLRLSRLNFVYLCKFMELNGYHNIHTKYGGYFSTYFASAILVFAFASVTLTAMQVAISVPSIKIPSDLVVTSYRFSIAVLIAVVGIVVSLMALFIPIVLADLRKGLLADVRLARKLRLEGLRATTMASKA